MNNLEVTAIKKCIKSIKYPLQFFLPRLLKTSYRISLVEPVSLNIHCLDMWLETCETQWPLLKSSQRKLISDVELRTSVVNVSLCGGWSSEEEKLGHQVKIKLLVQETT